VLALDAVSGAPLASFRDDGVETFGGTGYDGATDVVIAGNRAWVLGGFDSSDAGVGGVGTVNAGTFRGFLIGLPLPRATDTAQPSLSAVAQVGSLH